MSAPTLRVTVIAERVDGVLSKTRGRRCVEVVREGVVTRHAFPSADPRFVVLDLREMDAGDEFDAEWLRHGGDSVGDER